MQGPEHHLTSRRLREKTLRPPPFLSTHDVDYPEVFRMAAYVNRLIELRGASTGRLLRRSTLYHALGDFSQSLDDAKRVVLAEPGNSEGHFRLGAANLALALQRLQRLPVGVGTSHKKNRQRPRRLLIAAREAFLRAYRLNPRDEEAQQALDATDMYLAHLPETGAKKWSRPSEAT